MTYSSTTLIKGFRLLESLEKDGPQKLSPLAKRLNINTTTAFRLLYTLIELGCVKKRAEVYSLSYQTKAHLQFNNPQLDWISVPVMHNIVQKYHASAFIGILRGDSVVISQVIPKNNDPAEYQVLGQASPITMSALGKCALAFLPKAQQSEFLASMTFPIGTKYTLSERQLLEQNLTIIRHQGFALDDEESSVCVRCLAVPIYLNEQPIAALGISGSYNQLKRGQLKQMAKELTQCSQQISDEFF